MDCNGEVNEVGNDGWKLFMNPIPECLIIHIDANIYLFTLGVIYEADRPITVRDRFKVQGVIAVITVVKALLNRRFVVHSRSSSRSISFTFSRGDRRRFFTSSFAVAFFAHLLISANISERIASTRSVTVALSTSAW